MFYGVPKHEVENFSSAIETIVRSYDGHVFAADMMVAMRKNQTFRWDPRFVESFRSCTRTPQEHTLEWRLHTLTWAAKQALHIEGDFVECGVLRGFSSAVVCKYLDFATLPRCFYLYDAFSTLPEETSTEHERAISTQESAKDPSEWLGFVQNVFAPYPNARVIQGVIPFIFEKVVPEKIAYLHIDLNAAKAELMTLEHLFDKVTPGGIIIFDDFGWEDYRGQTAVELDFMRQRGLHILELPTGQGMVIKPPSTASTTHGSR